jgi:ribosome-binding protein aMBF1 (putative translation factor)
VRFEGTSYRAHDPRWSFKALSGDGAAIRGARFNPKGMPTLYLALSVMTAIKEANQGFAHKIEPCVLSFYEVVCDFCLVDPAKERAVAQASRKRPPRTTRSSAASGQHFKPAPGAPLISAFIDEGGRVAVQRVAESFGMSKGQLAETVGLNRETFHKTVRANAAKAQSRLREMLEIVGRVSPMPSASEAVMIGVVRPKERCSSRNRCDRLRRRGLRRSR